MSKYIAAIFCRALGHAALLCLAVIAGCVTHHNLSTEYQKFDSEVAKSRDAGLSERDRLALIENSYNETLALASRTGSLSDKSLPELRLLFRATDIVAFYANNEKYAEALKRLAAELQRRDSPDRALSSMKQLYGALIRFRMFTEAAALATEIPGFSDDPIPKTVIAMDATSTKPAEWVISRDGQLLTKQSVDLSAGAQVLIVSHPNCHFSRNAADAILRDPALMQRLASHVKWLAPQGTVDIADLTVWNLANAESPTTLVDQQRNWPQIDSWATPTFYFFKDGNVIAKLEGWPREGNKAKLEAALTLIGI